MDSFKSEGNGFNYIYENELAPNEERILKMPRVSANKRGVNDVGFQYEDGIVLSATLAQRPGDENTIWQEIQPFDEINKTTAYIKIVNSGEKSARVSIRAILN